jgi:hypothetical protein
MDLLVLYILYSLQSLAHLPGRLDLFVRLDPRFRLDPSYLLYLDL